MNWLSLDTDIFDDDKINSLIMRHGGDGFTIYIFLLTRVAKQLDIENEMNGYYKCDNPIEQIQWKFQPAEEYVEEILNTMADVGLIDEKEWKENEIIYINNFMDRKQTKTFLNKQRGGKKGASNRWNGNDNGNKSGNGTPNGTPKGTANGDKDKDIDKEQESTSTKPDVDEESSTDDSEKTEDDFKAQEIWEFYTSLFEPYYKPRKFGEKRKSKIKARLEEYSVEEIKKALKAIEASDYHTGKNENNKFYAKPDFCFRNDEKIEEWLNEYNSKHDQESRGLVT